MESPWPSGEVFIGRWYDYSYPYPFGDTVTLREREGNLLISAASLFVTLVSIRLWTIISFLLHQWRSQPGDTDGLFRQQQVVLRNSAGPFGTFLSMLTLGWAWRTTRTYGQRVLNLKSRILVLALPALIYTILFIILGVLSSQVARGENVRIVNGLCGVWGKDENEIHSEERLLNEMQQAHGYAHQCYQRRGTSLGCDIYPVDALPYSNKTDVDCPFGDDPDGQSLCMVPALKLQTHMLSSDTHFGINTGPDSRLSLQIRSTCAPLNISSYAQNFTDEFGADIYNYNLGPMGAQNYTFQYNSSLYNGGAGMQLDTVSGSSPPANVTGSWMPIAPLNVSNSTIGLAFLMQNSVHWAEPVLDPWLSSTLEVTVSGENSQVGKTRYESDYWVRPVGCSDQARVCNPVNSQCTDFVSISSVLDESTWGTLGLNYAQQATYIRFGWTIMDYAMSQPPLFLGTNALLAQNQIRALQWGNTLPDDQWKKEVEFWHQISLSLMQAKMIRLATQEEGARNHSGHGFDVWELGWYFNTTDTFVGAMIEQCSQTRVRSRNGYQNFSFVGLMLMFSLGMAIVLGSYLIEPCVAFKRKHWRMKHGYREVARVEERVLNLFARAHDNAGFEGWDSLHAEVPVAPAGIKFQSLMKPEHASEYQASWPETTAYPQLPTKVAGSYDPIDISEPNSGYSWMGSPHSSHTFYSR